MTSGRFISLEEELKEDELDFLISFFCCTSNCSSVAGTGFSLVCKGISTSLSEELLLDFWTAGTIGLSFLISMPSSGASSLCFLPLEELEDDLLEGFFTIGTSLTILLVLP